jgi:hypothetical protein
VLRAGRESTAGLSPLSTPDSFLMCYVPLAVVARALESQAASLLCEAAAGKREALTQNGTK